MQPARLRSLVVALTFLLWGPLQVVRSGPLEPKRHFEAGKWTLDNCKKFLREMSFGTGTSEGAATTTCKSECTEDPECTQVTITTTNEGGGGAILCQLEGKCDDNGNEGKLASKTAKDHPGFSKTYNKPMPNKEDQEAAMLYGDPLAYAQSVSKHCAFIVNYTTLYEPECFKVKPQILRPLLVTGSGGCGTHTTSDLFVEGGIHIGHESIDKDGASAWPYAINDYQVYGWASNPIMKGSGRQSQIHGKNGYVWGALESKIANTKLPTRKGDAMLLVEPRFERVCMQGHHIE